MSHNHAELLINGDRILPRLLEDIAAARKYIHVSMFLFFRDPIGEEVAAALSAKAQSGVKVRVLINIEKTGMGDPFSTGERQMMRHDPTFKENPMKVRPLCKKMTAAGVEVLDSNIDYDVMPKGLSPRFESLAAQVREGISVDEMHIDHRKIVVVDGHIGYCGGANIGAQYMHHVPFDPTRDAHEEGQARQKANLPEPWWKWHDSLTRFEGPIVTELDDVFRERWVLDGGQELPSEPFEPRENPTGTVVNSAKLYSSGPCKDPNQVRLLYLKLVREAQHSIFIENPYFYFPELVTALCEAKKARPELDVVVIVPSLRHNDNEYSQDAQEHEYVRYLECGIEVREYLNHFSHLKMAVFDERWSIHGSTNLNHRSLDDDKDFELVVLVDDEAFARWILANVRDVDRQHSRRIGEPDLHGTLAGLRRRVRDPRTLLLLSRRLL